MNPILSAKQAFEIYNKLDDIDIERLAEFHGINYSHYNTRNKKICGLVVILFKNVSYSVDDTDFINQKFES